MPDAEQTILKRTFGPTPLCLPVELLAARREASLPADSLAPPQHHLDTCSYCRSELALLEEFHAAKPTAEEAQQLAWMREEVSSRLRPLLISSSAKISWMGRLESFLSPSLRSWRNFGMVAITAVAITVIIQVRNSRGDVTVPGEPSSDVWRSLDFVDLAPTGATAAAPEKFSWRSIEGATRYRVRVMTVDESEVWRNETSTPFVSLTPELRSNFSPGRHFLWQVSAFDPSDKKLAESALQEFYVSPTR